ncbi:low affinity immunoglobulin gamma Fc region receptor II-like [Cheilinus undulatus]|uniref:low affinity immunoglobulin gamma Fc region receptor II-like n=1 Tax=Cheilinus undulatus TaxID=241271 RepID=UPI001BD6403C|nr:low affinity immunoglobulin gamma Fc region receptor II-like [Cheilinus undulatus]
MELTGFLLTLTSLTVSPDRCQFFKYESLSLSCEENRKPSTWRVNAETERGVSECGQDWGSVETSVCVITEAYQWNSGEYWCESQSGERSPALNITITDNSVILESPVLPVMEGESVTLRCTTQRNSSSPLVSVFMKDRSPVGASITGQVTLPTVSKSDEGLNMCVINDVGTSAESWISVRERATEEEKEQKLSDGFTTNGTVAPVPPESPLLSVNRLICLLVVGAPYLLSTVLLALVCRDRTNSVDESAAKPAGETTACNEVLMEEVQ